MDVLLRGSIERHVDRILEGGMPLDKALLMFRKGLAPTVKNVEDALFGYVIGRTIQFSFDAMQVHHKREPNGAEFSEIAEILVRRAMEIKSKIKLIANRYYARALVGKVFQLFQNTSFKQQRN